jgi:hypothetical protein
MINKINNNELNPHTAQQSHGKFNKGCAVDARVLKCLRLVAI